MNGYFDKVELDEIISFEKYLLQYVWLTEDSLYKFILLNLNSTDQSFLNWMLHMYLKVFLMEYLGGDE